MEEWMRDEFQKTGSEIEHYQVFTELFTKVFNEILHDNKVDALDCPNQLLLDDEPEFGTAQGVVGEESLKLFKKFLERINAGHSQEFARIFALKLYDHAFEDVDAARDAFQAIRTDGDCVISNRAYAEAHAVCLHQGRSALFAEKCSEYLINGDLCFSHAQTKAATYEKTFDACIAKGYPLIRAHAFAEYLVRPDVSGDLSFAEAFARVYEEQVAAGNSHTKAWNYADTFLGYYKPSWGDWEESEADGNNDRARIHTTGDLRGRGKGFDRTDYAKMFALHFGKALELPAQPLAERLAEVELHTDVAMKERMLRRAHRNDKGCAHATVYLNVATRCTATEAGGWDKLEQLGVSIAVTIAADGLQVFTEDKIQKLAGILAHAERIVGYNLRHLDLKVLEVYDGFSIGKACTVDLLDVVERAVGRRLSLQTLASATLGIGLQRDSLEMVKCWKAGRVLDVIEGCSDAVYAIKALDEYAREHGELFYFSSETQQRELILL